MARKPIKKEHGDGRHGSLSPEQFRGKEFESGDDQPRDSRRFSISLPYRREFSSKASRSGGNPFRGDNQSSDDRRSSSKPDGANISGDDHRIYSPLPSHFGSSSSTKKTGSGKSGEKQSGDSRRFSISHPHRQESSSKAFRSGGNPFRGDNQSSDDRRSRSKLDGANISGDDRRMYSPLPSRFGPSSSSKKTDSGKSGEKQSGDSRRFSISPPHRQESSSKAFRSGGNPFRCDYQSSDDRRSRSKPDGANISDDDRRIFSPLPSRSGPSSSSKKSGSGKSGEKQSGDGSSFPRRHGYSRNSGDVYGKLSGSKPVIEAVDGSCFSGTGSIPSRYNSPILLQGLGRCSEPNNIVDQIMGHDRTRKLKGERGRKPFKIQVGDPCCPRCANGKLYLRHYYPASQELN